MDLFLGGKIGKKNPQHLAGGNNERRKKGVGSIA
jgi:hypothetical protein